MTVASTVMARYITRAPVSGYVSSWRRHNQDPPLGRLGTNPSAVALMRSSLRSLILRGWGREARRRGLRGTDQCAGNGAWRSEEHTSELQSRGLISYAVFCLGKKGSRSFRAARPPQIRPDCVSLGVFQS